MATDIRVPIPKAGEDLQLYFDEMVENDQFGLALDYSVIEFDELARLTEVAVSRVDVTAADVAVHYGVSWEAFHACNDRRVGGTHQRVARGRGDGSHWVFDKAPTPLTRSSADEF